MWWSCLQEVDADTRRFQAQSARLMGDMKEAGDAPFRGEVELDSKVGALQAPLLLCYILSSQRTSASVLRPSAMTCTAAHALKF